MTSVTLLHELPARNSILMNSKMLIRPLPVYTIRCLNFHPKNVVKYVSFSGAVTLIHSDKSSYENQILKGPRQKFNASKIRKLIAKGEGGFGDVDFFVTKFYVCK